MKTSTSLILCGFYVDLFDTCTYTVHVCLLELYMNKGSRCTETQMMVGKRGEDGCTQLFITNMFTHDVL